MSNMAVYLQPLNKPKKRHLVGWLTTGSEPVEADYTQWGINPYDVLETVVRRVVGQWALVVVVHEEKRKEES